MSVSTAEDDKLNKISKKVSKILDSRIENDKEALTALKELSNYFPENSIQARRNLRSTIEKRSLGINEGFLNEFRKIKENLDLIYEDVYQMNQTVQTMSAHLHNTKAQTHKLIEQTTKLQAESTKLSLQEVISKTFIKTFQLTPEEVSTLRNTSITNEFFAALERVQTIHSNCKILMQSGHQTLALEIMDQMSLYQEASLERLYRWAQSYCKNIESPGTSQLLTRAISKLQDRPMLFKYVISEYCTHRRSVLVRIFLDALTKGGPGGTPKPIEMSAHDPQRYISDMLAFLHQSIPGENENLLSFLKDCDKIDVTEEIQESLANISEGVVTPLRIRIEHIVASEISLKTLYSITNLLCFYRQTFSQEISETSGLVRGLRELEEASGHTLIGKLSSVVGKEVIERVAMPPSDLSPSPGVESLLNLLKELLSVAPVSESQHYYLNKIVASVLDPLLQAVNISASRLATTDMAVYLLNCLHLIISTVSLYEFVDDRIERLQAQCDAQIDTLTSEQASFFVANLNLGPIYTILQDHGKAGPLSQIPGMQPASLLNFINKFDNFTSMPELLLLPQVTCLLSSSHRATVQKRSIQVIIAIYTQLYDAVNDPYNGYPDTMNLQPPKDVSEVLFGAKGGS
ncbi:unnamed protein product [Nezara viridula]|uniref:Conserved oligomeric Golgi complex subunit 6 n=1 Tax=Nezara viridula TaxID=85310 RepID=A0A9P0E6W7_NEZVI|nr:unnamed protein product [Nezara viridula]